MRTPTKFINKVLNVVGYELHKPGRKMAELMHLPPSPTSGWMLEFIGTQGIGKTTLVLDVYKHVKAHWLLRSDLGQTGPAEKASQALEDLHQDLFFKKLMQVKNEDPEPWRTITLARQMSKVTGESLTMLCHEFPRGFILDESVFKNFPREIVALPDDVSAPLWHKRAFIYVRARDPKFGLARYQSRVNARTNAGVLQNRPSDESVLARIETDNDLFDGIYAKAKTFDCPVLTIYAEDDHAANVNKIIAFEKTLHSPVS